MLMMESGILHFYGKWSMHDREWTIFTIETQSTIKSNKGVLL